VKELDIPAFASETRRRRLHLFLDFDGTLSPHRRDGARSRALPGARAAISVLCRAPGVRVSIISGRSISDLKPRVGVPRASYAGNHGLVISDAQASFEHPQAAAIRRSFAAAARLIVPRMRSVPRAQVEHNGLSLSLNVGLVPPPRRPMVGRIVRALRDELRALRLRWQEGYLGWELIADVGWNKGDALSHLMRASPRAFPVAVGDGTSDEAMFERVAGSGLAVRVGNCRSSAADRFLRDPAEVASFLYALAQAAGLRGAG
jgi:trehalose-phosphatase